jgi:2-iminobutanoate/2-iminopropanoate deaminase
MPNPLKKVESSKAPEAIGPYSQAVEAGGFLFVSGQLPINPHTGELVEPNIKKQTEQVLFNIVSILQENMVVIDRVVKTEVFLADIKDFKAMNEVYAEFFKGEVMPARQAIQAAALPKGALVEISCIAYVGD